MSEDTIDTQAVGDEAVMSTAPVDVSDISELARKMRVKGTVERLELYGAFIDIGLDERALIHISKLDKGHVNRVSDVVNVGDEVVAWVDKVDPEQNQIMLTLVPPLAVEWSDLKAGQTYEGKVTRLESFGAFIDFGAEREGLVHISELSHDYVKHPSEVVNVGDEVAVQILGVNKRKRRIDLSMKATQEAPESDETILAEANQILEAEVEEDYPTAMEIAMRRAMSKDDPGDGGKKRSRAQRKKDAQNDILGRTLKLRD